MASLCETYGFDPETRAARLKWAGLDGDDHRLAALAQQAVISPALAAIVETLFGALGELPAFWSVLRAGGHTAVRLKRFVVQYLITLGTDFDTEGYFETRLRVGLVHARAGLPLSLYTAAFASLQRILVARVRASVADPMVRAQLTDHLLKITSLDLALATEVHHLAQVRGLERSLEESRVVERTLRNRASHDSLTGLTNRDFVLATLEHALGDAQEDRTPLCVIMADLDHFKDVNDTHGHLVGDEVLRHTTDRMGSVLRSTDLLGRYGGEEFLVILRNTPVATARRIAERMRAQVAEGPIRVGALRIPMTISQGLVQVRWGESPKDVIARADAAMYAAKQAGRNRVEVVDAPLRQRSAS